MRDFLDLVEKEAARRGCWEWKGAFNKDMTPRYRGSPARDYAFERWRGEVPKGARVVANCANWLCVCPEHLKLYPSKERRKKASYRIPEDSALMVEALAKELGYRPEVFIARVLREWLVARGRGVFGKTGEYVRCGDPKCELDGECKCEFLSRFCQLRDGRGPNDQKF